MPSDQIDITVRVNADTGGLEVVNAGLGRTQQAAKGAEGSFSGLDSAAAKLAGTLAAGFTAGAVISFFADAVRGANEEAESLRRLSFVLQANGQSWSENSKKVQDWSSEIQKATRFSDSEALSVLENMARATKDLSQALSASEVAMGLSAATGKSLAETQQLLIGLIGGNSRAVREAKRELGAFVGDARNAQEVLDRLSEKFGTAAEAEESTAKATLRLKNSYSELKDVIGQALLPALDSFADRASKILDLATRTIQTIRSADIPLGKHDDGTREIEQAKAREASKTAVVEAGASERVRIVARKSEEEIAKEKAAAEEIKKIRDKLAEDYVAAADSEVLAKIIRLNQEVEELRRKGVETFEIRRAGVEQIITLEEYKRARMSAINKEIDQEEQQRAEKMAGELGRINKKKLEDLKDSLKQQNEEMKKSYAIFTEISTTAANVISNEFGNAFAKTIVEGEALKINMVRILETIIAKAIEAAIQLALVKLATSTVSGPGAFLPLGRATSLSPASGLIVPGPGSVQSNRSAPGASEFFKAMAQAINAGGPDALRLALSIKNLSDKFPTRAV